MALNWAMLNPDRSPVPLPREQTITVLDSGVELSLSIPDTPPSGPNATAGGSGGAKRLKENGKLWITDQRLIFTTNQVSPPDAALTSLSVPLPSIISTHFIQPLIATNYFAFEIKPSEGGGLADGTRAEIRFKDRPMFEFVSLLEKTRERAIYMKRAEVEEEEGLPIYPAPPETPGPSGANSSEVPADGPPGYDASV